MAWSLLCPSGNGDTNHWLLFNHNHPNVTKIFLFPSPLTVMWLILLPFLSSSGKQITNLASSIEPSRRGPCLILALGRRQPPDQVGAWWRRARATVCTRERARVLLACDGHETGSPGSGFRERRYVSGLWRLGSGGKT